MNLNKNTRINALMYVDKNNSTVVSSRDLNMIFDSYVNSCDNGIKTNLNAMYRFNYTKEKSMTSNEYEFTIYSYQDNRYNCSFIELKKLTSNKI